MRQLSEREARAMQHEISYAESRREEAQAELRWHATYVQTWQERVTHWEDQLSDLKARAQSAT